MNITKSGWSTRRLYARGGYWLKKIIVDGYRKDVRPRPSFWEIRKCRVNRPGVSGGACSERTIPDDARSGEHDVERRTDGVVPRGQLALVITYAATPWISLMRRRIPLWHSVAREG